VENHGRMGLLIQECCNHLTNLLQTGWIILKAQEDCIRGNAPTGQTTLKDKVL
jgi:hypothetical protein